MTVTPTRPDGPQAAWRRLEEGNARFAADDAGAAEVGRSRRAELLAGQSPFALVLGCSDSRVPAEIVFDQGLGDLFVIRTAGHVVDTTVLGSVEFGVSALGVDLVVVMGHEACGAVRATMTALDNGTVPTGFVRDVVERVTPSVLAARRHDEITIHDVVTEHVRGTAALLLERSSVLSDAVASGRCGVVGVTYALSTGLIEHVALTSE